jgi:single-strand DNA-binding protein
MNNVNLVGHLTPHDPKLVEKGERQICEMRLAVDNGRFATTFIDVRSFGEHAYACAEYLYKGRRVGVSGRLAHDQWRNGEGQKRERYSVIGRVEFLDRPRGDQHSAERAPRPEGSQPDQAETLPELPLAAELVAA